MESTLVVGIILIAGFIFGEIAVELKLPKVTGYICAGILLNPQVLNIIPKDITSHTSLITNLSLSFITFSIGGTLFYSHIKKLGRSIVSITVCEAEFTFLLVALGFVAVLPFLIHNPKATFLATFIPISILLAALASPTDPTGTLAVTHEYKAHGDVTSTILSVSAFDDALGLMNYSIAVVLAEVLILHQRFSVYSSLLKPLIIIVGALALGMAFGFIFNLITYLIKKETEGVFIVVILGLLSLCFGTARLLGIDELLATMTVGIVVVNFNVQRDKIFKVLERYTEELVFVLFFTLSGMYLDFSTLPTASIIIFLVAIFRAAGKYTGTLVGASLSHSPPLVKKYTALGLIPAGGIIVGLALMLKQVPAYDAISNVIINVIIGVTVIHELIGPIFVKIALKKSGEIKAKEYA